jgi:LacI family transcriptional regulator
MPAKELPDGVFAANDLVALGLLKSLYLNGTRIPQRVAIIGYDDIALAGHSLLPLASIRQPSSKIGETALALLMSEIDREPGHERRQVLLKPKLVVRESARA